MVNQVVLTAIICEYMTQTPKSSGLAPAVPQMPWKIWEQFAHTLQHAFSWFNFLVNLYLTAYERLPLSAFSRFMPWAFLTFLLKLPRPQVVQGWVRSIWLLLGLQYSDPWHCFWDPPHTNWDGRFWWINFPFLSCCLTALVTSFPPSVPDEPPGSVLVTPHTTSSVLVQWQVGKIENRGVSHWHWLVGLNGSLQWLLFWAGRSVVKLKDFLVFLICAFISVLEISGCCLCFVPHEGKLEREEFLPRCLWLQFVQIHLSSYWYQ